MPPCIRPKRACLLPQSMYLHCLRGRLRVVLGARHRLQPRHRASSPIAPPHRQVMWPGPGAVEQLIEIGMCSYMWGMEDCCMPACWMLQSSNRYSTALHAGADAADPNSRSSMAATPHATSTQAVSGHRSTHAPATSRSSTHLCDARSVIHLSRPTAIAVDPTSRAHLADRPRRTATGRRARHAQ